MKRPLLIIFIVSASAHATVPTDCLISVEPHWQQIESNRSREKLLGGKWMLVGSITFRKKSNLQEKLEKMRLTWHGTQIPHLYGSLYKKLPDKKFVPIEQNLVCDGRWNKARQELILNFKDNKQTLGPLSIFYLVLTVPSDIEMVLKDGHFSVAQDELPAPFQAQSDSLKIDLAHLQV